jgi:hypothetical protein
MAAIAPPGASASEQLGRLRTLWSSGAARRYFGRCHTCDRTRGDEGRPLLVAHQARSRRGFECFDCWFGHLPKRVQRACGDRR